MTLLWLEGIFSKVTLLIILAFMWTRFYFMDYDYDQADDERASGGFEPGCQMTGAASAEAPARAGARCQPSKLRKLHRADGPRESCKIARPRVPLIRRHGRRRAARPLFRSVNMLEQKAGDEEQERRLPDAAMPIDHLLGGAYHPEGIGFGAAGRREHERLVPGRAGQ
jgi:hypothetical protein